MMRFLSKLLSAMPAVRSEMLALLVSLFFAIACNLPFWRAALTGRELAQPATLLYAATLLVLLAVVHFLPLVLLLNRRSAKPLLALLFICTAFAVYFMNKFGIYLDPSMIRNALRTNTAEAGELLAWDMIPALLLYAGLPLLVIWHLQLVPAPSLRNALTRRLIVIALGTLAGVAALMISFQDIASMMRNHKELRYLITPANLVYSTTRAASADVARGDRPKLPVGTDARLGERWPAAGARPVLLLLVVGETARAANWGLSGYARQTTPQLAKLDVLNFPDTTSCGTNTEVSVPCMFSPFGRRHYDETKIRDSESLLHVLDHAGIGVEWRDNQSGCKGVCSGLAEIRVDAGTAGALCNSEHCLDEALLLGLDDLARRPARGQVVVMHQLGNHGPAYFRRYPPEFRRFLPVCENNDLARCTREEIVNAYDNALLYTDHVLAQTIATLRSLEKTHDTAMIYVSDHGESLGESNLFLHGMPYPIAPKVQTQVPMVMWLSPGFTHRFALDTACLRQRTTQPASHDHLFHTVLGLLDIRTGVYDHSLDLSAACRGPSSHRS